MPKLAEPLRTVLIETVQRQTNELRKTFDPSRDGADKNGLTKAQRDFIGHVYGQHYSAAATTVVFFNPKLVELGFNKVQEIAVKCREEASAVAVPTLLPLVAVYIEKAAIGLNDVPVLVTHNEKATILDTKGIADKSSLTMKDKFRLCTDAEVIELIDNFTEQQIATVITHRYFDGVRLDAMMKHDDDADDSGDGDVKKPKTRKPKPTPVSV